MSTRAREKPIVLPGVLAAALALAVLLPVAAQGEPSLAGYVWVNGDVFVPAAGVPVRFAGDGFELTTTTDTNGYYQFAQLGQDVGVLSLGGEWKASVGGVTLSVPPGAALRVNFSASKASAERGPALLTVSVAPSVIGAGQAATITIKAVNSTGAKVSGVWLTHLVPDGLVVSGVRTDRGDARSVSGLAMANVGDMAPGDSATFTVVASASVNGGPHGNLPIVASMISREGVAVQASTTLRGMGGPSTLPVTGSGEWLSMLGLLLAALLIGVNRLRRRAASP